MNANSTDLTDGDGMSVDASQKRNLSNSFTAKASRLSIECDSCKIVEFSSETSGETAPIRSQTCGHSICRACVIQRHIAKCETTGRSKVVWLNCPICNNSKRAFNVLNPIVDTTLCNLIREYSPEKQTQALKTTISLRCAVKSDNISIPKLHPAAFESRRDRAMRIEIGDWVLFEGGDYDGEEVIWLGRAVRNTDNRFKNTCKWVNMGRSKVLCGVTIGRNDIALSIRWYHQISMHLDRKCDYRYENEASSIQNHAYFLFGGFEMAQIKGPPKKYVPTRSRAHAASETEVEAQRVWQLRDPSIMKKAFSMLEFH